MPKRPRFRTAAQFAAQRAAGGGAGKFVPTPFKPQLGQQINKNTIDFRTVQNLFPTNQYGGGYAPRGGGVLTRPGGAGRVPAAPSGQWWVDDYTGGDPMFTLAGQTGPGGKVNINDLAGLGVNPASQHIAGTQGLDIRSGVESDWELAAAMRDIAAANAADAAQTKQSIESLAVQWGGDLSGLVKQGLISQKTADMAAANQFSSMGELGRALKTGSENAVYRAAARGGGSSGMIPAATTGLNRQYQKETTTGLQGVMSQIQGWKLQQAQAAAERQQQLMGVRAGIAARLSQDPRYQSTPGMEAFYNAEEGGWVDDIGRVFDQQGRRIR